MPEAPELYLIREWLEPRLLGRSVEGVRLLRPLVMRNLMDVEPHAALAGRRFASVERDGKLLLFGFESEVSLVVSPMLAGELRLVAQSARVARSTIVALELSDGNELRYLDQRRMGQLYLIPTADVSGLARVERQGPDVLDSPMTYDAMCTALRAFRGELKTVLTSGKFVGGVGNAYADEILWYAGLYPFVKVSRLADDARSRLHDALLAAPRQAVADLRSAFEAEGLEPKKYRSILKVHGKSGEPCPRCGSRISAVKVRRRETNFCRSCQPGSLVGGA